MRKRFFKDCHCAEELRSEYFRLVMIHHPDRGGDEEIMKAINNEYDFIFPKLKDIHPNTKEEMKEKYYTASKPTSEAPEAFRYIIYTLLAFKGIQVELVGRWIWITGNTKPYKEKLGINGLGCRWHVKKQAWSWHYEGDGVVSHGKKSLNEIRKTYGSVKFEESEQLLLG